LRQLLASVLLVLNSRLNTKSAMTIFGILRPFLRDRTSPQQTNALEGEQDGTTAASSAAHF
jgi:hypothetical protein